MADVPREISAGITLAALMIPLNIGYAQVAGLPPVAGLYAAIIPLAVFALLTSSRHLVTSPDASMAGLVGAALVAFAAPGDPLRLQFALALAVICGLVFFVFWFFRLAFLANFLSRAVMAGFITGLGIEVFTNQVRKILAAPHVESAAGALAAAERLKDAMASSVETEGYFVELVALFESIPRANLYSVAIGVSAFLIVRLMKRYTPKIPGALVALVLLTVIVAVFDLAAKGVGVLGEMPSGPPALTVPAIPLADYLRLLPSALAIVAILLCEGLLVVRSYSSKYGYKVDGDQMLFAYGAANIAAGFTGSLVTGNSPSRSAAMDASGARSQLPSLVAAGTIAVVMLFVTDMLAFLP
ncbi:MAG: SulP family inorganic anion transporter, partial [Gemmatimonadota bacterium]